MNIIALKHKELNLRFCEANSYRNVEFKKPKCTTETPGLDSMKRVKGKCFDQFIVTKTVFFTDEKKRIPTIIIPRGFITDFASVPQFLWSIFPPHGLATIPSIVHDYLYVYGVGERKDADDIFRELLLKEGMNKLSAFLMWQAVRKFGAPRFNREERAKEAVMDISENDLINI